MFSVSATGKGERREDRWAEAFFGVERRSYARASVNVPGRMSWITRRSFSQSGTVINISRNGVLFTTRVCHSNAPALGLHARLEIFVAGGVHARCLYCEGRIVRIGASIGRPLELALRVIRMKFRAAHGPAPHRHSL